MTRRKSGTNWSWLRWLIEFNLRRHPDFQKNFRLEEKIRPLGSGLFHKNYLFGASGKDLVLRLGVVERDLQTQRQAVKSLRQEAKTLHALRLFHLPFVVPELLCERGKNHTYPALTRDSAKRGNVFSVMNWRVL